MSSASESSMRFRFTQVEESSDEQALLNLCPSSALFDVSNVIACNESYIAIPWHHSNGVAVFAQGEHGKVDLSSIPVLTARAGAITNVAFDRFQPNCLCSCHDDGAVCIWRIPDNNRTDVYCESKPEYTLYGHSKRCNVISFHPTASGVCASAGLDGVLNIWDVETGQAECVINQDELFSYPTGVEWNEDGSQLCVSSREKQLLLLDPRCSFTSSFSSSSSSEKSINVIHTHNRQLRCIWPTRHDTCNNIITCSVDEYHRRGLEVWDCRALHSPISNVCLDQSSAHMIPCYDHDLNLLYLATRGEAGFVCYALQHGSLHLSYEYAGNHLVKGMCAAPKWMLNLRANEYNRLFQLTSNSLITLHASLPRRNSNDDDKNVVEKEKKQSEVPFDLYPYTNANKAAMTSEMYFAHTNVKPIRCDLRGLLANDKKVIIIHEENKQEHRLTETMSRISEAHDSENEKMEKEEQVLEQKQQSINEVNDVNETTSTKRAKHVDPASSDMLMQQHNYLADNNLVQSHTNNTTNINDNYDDKRSKVWKLVSEIHNAQSELISMRAALRNKEEEIDQLISALIQLISK